MKVVKCYETEDGQKFVDRLTAERHESMLKLRGLIQSKVNGSGCSVTAVCQILVDNLDESFKIMQKLRQKKGSINAAKTRLGRNKQKKG